MTIGGAGMAALRVTASTESAVVTSARYRFLIAATGVVSVFASICAATACAFRDALRGTRTNAISAAMNTRPPTIPKTATLRSEFLARAAIERWAGRPPRRDMVGTVMTQRYGHGHRYGNRRRALLAALVCVESGWCYWTVT